MHQRRRTGGRDTVSVVFGDTSVEVHPDFRVYMSSEESSPSIVVTAHTSTQAAVVNFTMDQAGLREQLLAQLLEAERPKLQAEKVCLVGGGGVCV